jgi:hypothetical protein
MTANNYDFIIREAQPVDDAALRRLAALDGIAAYPEEPGRGRVPRGRLLVAEADGRLVAAVPLSGGPAIADPFRKTAGLVSLLGLRAAQLRGLADRRAPGALGWRPARSRGGRRQRTHFGRATPEARRGRIAIGRSP